GAWPRWPWHTAWRGRPARVGSWPGWPWHKMAFGTFLGVLAALGFVRIVTRNGDWRDDGTYYRVTLAAVPEAGSLRLNLGAVYWNRRQPDAAEREWKEALKTSPDSAQLLNNLGL